jgi:hypothetical protein
VGVLRYLTILWPGLPWVWLRGSLTGLVVALGFAVTLDVAVVTTWIWTDLIGLPSTVAVWSAAVALWLMATASAVSSFPPPIPVGRIPDADRLFVAARNAYLARDWAGAEARLEQLLTIAPTDGEAQLLKATLLRRVGRLEESRSALEQLARSDSGAVWTTAIGRERSLLEAASRDDSPTTLPMAAPPPREQAA